MIKAAGASGHVAIGGEAWRRCSESSRKTWSVPIFPVFPVFHILVFHDQFGRQAQPCLAVGAGPRGAARERAQHAFDCRIIDRLLAAAVGCEHLRQEHGQCFGRREQPLTMDRQQFLETVEHLWASEHVEKSVGVHLLHAMSDASLLLQCRLMARIHVGWLRRSLVAFGDATVPPPGPAFPQLSQRLALILVPFDCDPAPSIFKKVCRRRNHPQSFLSTRIFCSSCY